MSRHTNDRKERNRKNALKFRASIEAGDWDYFLLHDADATQAAFTKWFTRTHDVKQRHRQQGKPGQYIHTVSLSSKTQDNPPPVEHDEKATNRDVYSSTLPRQTSSDNSRNGSSSETKKAAYAGGILTHIFFTADRHHNTNTSTTDTSDEQPNEDDHRRKLPRFTRWARQPWQ
ncbi:MAG: hypothetical protein L6R37_004235 [Teloschistes peruensis]|nr:MAG: hypothetical protein L6R37_004235 [Teloschistes peruensis]